MRAMACERIMVAGCAFEDFCSLKKIRLFWLRQREACATRKVSRRELLEGALRPVSSGNGEEGKSLGEVIKVVKLILAEKV